MHRFAWEYLQRGNAYLFHDQFSITISQIYQIPDAGQLESAELIQNEWLVEIHSAPSLQEQVPVISKSLVNFTAYLEG
jgi:hypothetical protein